MGDSDTSLLLSLKHPQPTIRVSAVEHLMSVIRKDQVRREASLPVSSQRENHCWRSNTHICPEQHRSLTSTFLKDAVTDRLKDDVPEVVAAALKVLEVSGDAAAAAAAAVGVSPEGRLERCSLFCCVCLFSCSLTFWTLNTSCRVCCRCCTEWNRPPSSGQ